MLELRHKGRKVPNFKCTSEEEGGSLGEEESFDLGWIKEEARGRDIDIAEDFGGSAFE